MNVLSFNASDQCIFSRIRKAAEQGTFNGRDMTVYFENCRWVVERYGCMVIYTRDIGHHTSGFLKNPDYERCYHLSLSFPGGRNRKAFNTIINNIFGHDKKWIWTEPPYSEKGKKAGVWHYRLFCNDHWKPIKPRGEVYSKKYTDRGWKSFSELH